MKTKLLAASSGFVLLLLIFFMAGCQKEEGILPGGKISTRAAGINCNTGLTTTYPANVCLGDNFTLTTVGTCGRWKIQETTTNAACDATIGWTDLNGAFTCAGPYTYTTLVPRAVGVYHFRTVHLQNVTGLCSNPTCSGFTGEQYCCFDVTVAPCNEEICYGPGETGWSYGPEYEEGGQWATYTAVGDFPVTLYAGQTMNAGTVSYAGGMITITLAAGWEFANVSENVKIQGYSVAPTTEPIPGQFDNKTTAAIGSSPYSVAVAAANFYGVHVDLVPIIECE